MIRRIQARNYRCLRYVDVALDPFHLLVGPNASGKSTLFDVVAFLRDLVAEGLEAAVRNRTQNFQDLVWNRAEAQGFELALEFDIPEDIQKQLPKEKEFRVFRYEIFIREKRSMEVLIESERGILMPLRDVKPRRTELFPDPPPAPDTILRGGGRRGERTVLSKSAGKSDSFSSETAVRAGKGRAISLGPRRSTLRNLPESPEEFPASTYVKRILKQNVQTLFLNSMKLRQPSPPEFARNGFAPDGSSLPWAVRRLKERHREDYDDWLRHVQAILTDLADIEVAVRDDDRQAHLILEYGAGVKVPSWEASDGTLRLLALTLLAYLPDRHEIYLLEEPESGIHPMAVDCVYQSLNSVYDSQVLFATNSPIVLKMARPEEVLCFAKNAEGATDTVRGNDHPRLRGWQGPHNTEPLFATGSFG